MQVNNLSNYTRITNKQSFKGNESVQEDTSTPKQLFEPIPVESARAYASPQINQGYKTLKTFDVPYVGNSKVYELSNGHKIIIIPKAGPTAIYTTVGVGNLNEPAEKKEMSHLLEHLLAGTYLGNKIPEVDKLLAKTGAEYNAMTCNYTTNYYLKAPVYKTEDLDDLLNVQAQTIQNNNFTDNDIEHEKTIIKQELDSRKLAQNSTLLAQKYTLKNLFNLQDSDDLVIQSSNSSIENIQKEDLENYYKNFYQPQNMVTTIVGSVDDNTIKTVAKYFGQMKTEENSNPINYPKIPTDNLIEKTVRQDVKSLDKDSELAEINLSFIGPKNNDNQSGLKLEALKEIIRNRFKKASKNCETESFFSTYSTVISSDKNTPSIFTIKGKNKECYNEENLKVLYAILFDLTQNPITEDELKSIQKDFKKMSTYGKEYAMDMAEIYSDSAILSEELDDTKFLQGINSLTAKDIQETAQQYIDLNKASLVVIHPQKPVSDKPIDAKNVSFKGLSTDSTANNAKTPQPPTVSFQGNFAQINNEDIHEYILPNNLKVVVDTRPGITKSAINFNLHSQKSIYANPEAGVSLFAFLDSKETKEKLKKDEICAYSDSNTQQITTNFSGDADKTLEMLGYAAGIVLNPSFNQKVFNKFKEKRLEQQNPKKEVSIEAKASDEILKESPYHYTEVGLNSLTLEDLKALHQQILENSQGSIFITMPKEKFDEMKDQIFDTLMKVPELQPYDYNTIFNKVDFKPFDKTKVLVKEKDDSQIKVKQYFKIIESGNIKDRAGLMILNEALGGSDKALMFKTLRDRDKIAYSADSGYQVVLSTGKMSKIAMGTSVAANSENLHKVFEDFNNCINELTTKPIIKEDLERIKTKLKNKIIYDTESTEDKNYSVRDGYNSFYGVNYQEALMDSIDNMTPEYVQGLANLYLTQHSLITVSGNKDVIETEKDYLAKLGEMTNVENN